MPLLCLPFKINRLWLCLFYFCRLLCPPNMSWKLIFLYDAVGTLIVKCDLYFLCHTILSFYNLQKTVKASCQLSHTTELNHWAWCALFDNVRNLHRCKRREIIWSKMSRNEEVMFLDVFYHSCVFMIRLCVTVMGLCSFYWLLFIYIKSNAKSKTVYLYSG